MNFLKQKNHAPALWVLTLIFILSSCIGSRIDPARVDTAVNKLASTTVVCPPASPTACALESPYKELAKKIFSFSSGSPPHYVNLLSHGDEAFIIRVHLIRSARETIYIQSFIWGKDETSYFINRELLKAARRGVRIKVLVDQLGLLGKGPKLEFGAVAHTNIELKIYNPILNKAHTGYLEMLEAALFDFGGLNQRMHNKLMIVDGQIAITGGRNVEDKYFDMDPTYNFKDLDILVVGPVVKNMTHSFKKYWNHDLAVFVKDLTDVGRKIVGLNHTDPVQKLLHSSGPPRLRDWDQKASDSDYIKDTFSSKAMKVIGRVDFFSDSPGKKDDGDPLSESTLAARESLFQQARESLLIQTPYLFFSRFALDRFKQIRQQYPDLEIVVSSNSLAATDNFPVYANSIKQKKRLIEDLKIQIFEFKPIPKDVRLMIRGYDQLASKKKNLKENLFKKVNEIWEGAYPGPRVGLHTKAFVVNGRIAWIGSHNFDPRSDNLNTEAALVVWDERVARALTQIIHRDIEPQNSWVVARRWKIPVFAVLSGFFESLWRTFPIFDIWPFYCCTSFELRAGRTACPPDHPEFYDNYDAVGPYPEMNLSPKEIETRLFKAMGGWTTPIL